MIFLWISSSILFIFPFLSSLFIFWCARSWQKRFFEQTPYVFFSHWKPLSSFLVICIFNNIVVVVVVIVIILFLPSSSPLLFLFDTINRRKLLIWHALIGKLHEESCLILLFSLTFDFQLALKAQSNSWRDHSFSLILFEHLSSWESNLLIKVNIHFACLCPDQLKAPCFSCKNSDSNMAAFCMINFFISFSLSLSAFLSSFSCTYAQPTTEADMHNLSFLSFSLFLSTSSFSIANKIKKSFSNIQVMHIDERCDSCISLFFSSHSFSFVVSFSDQYEGKDAVKHDAILHRRFCFRLCTTRRCARCCLSIRFE